MLFILLLYMYIPKSLHLIFKGAHNPPNYGDYEAQRHWMELTINLPASQWYSNTTLNDRSHWPLDYPPLTAYHSSLMGYFSSIYEPESMELNASRGYETPTHKNYMRMTVILSDSIFYVGVIAWFFCRVKYNPAIKSLLCGLVLLVPGFILIDHGHFQYNCVMHGIKINIFC